MIFADPGCQNVSGRIIPKNDPYEPFYYNKRDINYMNLHENQISSVMVPYGYTMTLYDIDGQSPAGASEVVHGRARDGAGNMQCVNLTDLDNRASSLTYQKDSKVTTPANGVW